MGRAASKKIVAIATLVTLTIVLGTGVYAIIGSYRMSLIPGMSFEDMLNYTTGGNKDAVITVGTIRDGQMRHTVYGENGTTLPQYEHTYEIGSVTKTFTGSLLCKAISDGRVAIDDSMGPYLSLPQGNHYPTFRESVTHTSGYKPHYFDWQMVSNFLRRRNHFRGIGTDRLVAQASEHILGHKTYPFEYSNFGLSCVGNALAQIYDGTYSDVIGHFISSELQLENTRICDGTGDLGRYWEWKSDDGYLPAGGLQSNIGDMLRYINLHMTGGLPYLSTGHEGLVEINATTAMYEKLGIRMDSAGIGWMIDAQNGIIWHNGGTGNYNCYVAFDKKEQIGVVVLSNLAPGYRIPATVMGARLMRDLQSQASSVSNCGEFVRSLASPD